MEPGRGAGRAEGAHRLRLMAARRDPARAARCRFQSAWIIGAVCPVTCDATKVCAKRLCTSRARLDNEAEAALTLPDSSVARALFSLISFMPSMRSLNLSIISVFCWNSRSCCSMISRLLRHCDDRQDRRLADNHEHRRTIGDRPHLSVNGRIDLAAVKSFDIP